VLFSSPKGEVNTRVKLTDFALCRVDGEDANEGWSALADAYKTLASDLFSVGCIIGYSLSWGKHPHRSNLEKRVSRIRKPKEIKLTAEKLTGVVSGA